MRPPVPKVQTGKAVFDSGSAAVAEIRTIEQMAGGSVGAAVIAYPARYARDADPQMGGGCTLKLGNKVVFHGVVIDGPFDVDNADDIVELMLVDDKHLMQAHTVGEPGIGTIAGGDGGFTDVGFEIVFNKDGGPNKKSGSRDFSLGSSAVYWSLKQALLFVFENYITGVTIDDSKLSSAYDVTPSHVDVTGQTALQAVDTLVQLSGESWGLVPRSSSSAFTPVKPGSGTVRSIFLPEPNAGAQATDATQYTPSSVRVAKSIVDCKDNYQAISAPIVKEHTYRNAGSNPLLTLLAGFEDKEYSARFAVDVSKYSEHSLGNDRSTGAQPKPWLPQLLTRIKSDGTAYLTAAELAATPALRAAPRAGKPFVWLATDGVEANAKLVTGGIRIDPQHATIDFKSQVELANDNGESAKKTSVTDWSAVGIWLTVATLLEVPEWSETAAENQYLTVSMNQQIRKPDLVPEKREDVWLPDLSGNNNAVSKVAEGSEESYVDISGELDVAIDAAIAATSTTEISLDLEFEFIPTFNIGDHITLRGRDAGESGDEVVTKVAYNVARAYETRVHATNLVGSVDPDNFIEG